MVKGSEGNTTPKPSPVAKGRRRFLTNPLFREDFNSDLNAAVGDNGGPYDFGCYGQGFFEGGFGVIAAARAFKAPVDILIYPAVFSFRHGIELYIKHFLSELKAQGVSNIDYNRDHKLEGNWATFEKAAIGSGLPEFTMEQLREAGKFIDHFCEIDPTGMVFRYPEDLKGNRHLTEVALINVEILETGMRRLFETFEDWHRHLYQRRGMVGAEDE